MSTYPSISVVIPLYNKAGRIGRALKSVFAQSLLPLEVIVVDDGSTDGGAAEVEAMASSLVRVVRQPNAGVSAARNLGAQLAQGEFIALLDADDWWDEGFLRHIAAMIVRHPGCGIYCTGYRIHRPEGEIINEHFIKRDGIVENYFRASQGTTLCWTSACVIPREVLLGSGGFPVGMRRGQDLYTWTQIAIRHRVCYSPLRLSNYDLTIADNSRTRFRPDQSGRSMLDFFAPGQDDLNEYIARVQIGIGLLQSECGYTDLARQTERDTAYNRRYRRGWYKLYILNRLPVRMRRPVMDAWRRLAWIVARKGIAE